MLACSYWLDNTDASFFRLIGTSRGLRLTGGMALALAVADGPVAAGASAVPPHPAKSHDAGRSAAIRQLP